MTTLHHDASRDTESNPAAQPQEFDASQLRAALGAMATSVTIVTTHHGGERYGFTANSFTSVSSSPPLVAVFLAETADSYAAFCEADRVAVNILADGQGEIANHFARKNTDKFAEVTLDDAHPDLPVIDGHMAALKGRIAHRDDAGDHLMLLIEVEAVSASDNPPLVYQNRAYRNLV
ncbi:flavin reductase family protein [Demequina sediminicola]|uniref:flavin reductase family protein n=1 Tax=Demequina sediminicola TaxID=1095026 RepID=UPI0007836089|nr:flavin reductase family protein [Demequina sediminicola]